MSELDLSKRDMTVVYGDRTLATCFAAAVGFLAATVDAAGGAQGI
jgi:hypothetical protein